MRPSQFIAHLLAHPPFAILLVLTVISILSRVFLLLS